MSDEARAPRLPVGDVSLLKALEAERDSLKAQLAFVQEQLEGKASLDRGAFKHVEAERDRLRAEVEMLRGVGCMEDGDGPCGACLKCARHAIRELAERALLFDNYSPLTVAQVATAKARAALEPSRREAQPTVDVGGPPFERGRASCWALVDHDGVVQSEVFFHERDARAEVADWPDCRLVRFVEAQPETVAVPRQTVQYACDSAEELLAWCSERWDVMGTEWPDDAPGNECDALEGDVAELRALLAKEGA